MNTLIIATLLLPLVIQMTIDPSESRRCLTSAISMLLIIASALIIPLNKVIGSLNSHDSKIELFLFAFVMLSSLTMSVSMSAIVYQILNKDKPKSRRTTRRRR